MFNTVEIRTYPAAFQFEMSHSTLQSTLDHKIEWLQRRRRQLIAPGTIRAC